MGGIELLNPKGLWLLTGLAPLIVLYILKIRRTRVRVASTWLWESARRDLLAKHPFRKLVAELPLLLQILALVALAVALARPASRGHRIEGDHVAIVIDTSASMATLLKGEGPGGETRLARAKKAAADVVGRLAPGADAFVLEAAREARVISPLERDARHLQAAIEALTVREVEGDLSQAIGLAADRLRALGGSHKLVVVTDGALANGAPLAAAGMDLQVLGVGDDVDNAALVRVDVRSGVDPATKREQVQVFALVKNYGAAARDTFVTLTVDGHTGPVASRRVLVPAGEKTPVVLVFEPEPLDRGRGLVVQIAPGDALTVDDVAYGRVPQGAKMPVVLATREGPSDASWLARALDADPSAELQRLTFAQLATVNIDSDALIVVDGACPDALPGRDALIVLPRDAAGSCRGIDIGTAVENPPVTSWEVGDPRFRFLTLDGVHVARAHWLKAEGAGAQLVRASGGTLVADASVPGRTVTLVGFDVGESDWPLKASFVLFVRNVVEQARLHRAQGAAGPSRTGEPLHVAVPAGTEQLTLEGPALPTKDLAAKDGAAIVPPLDRAGFYTLRWSTPHVGSTLLVANLTSEKESDVRPHPVGVTTGGGAPAVAAQVPEAHTEWAPWLALFAALVLAFDIWWLTRSPRIVPVAGLPVMPSGRRGA